MQTKLTSVPKSCCKYYQPFNLNVDTFQDVASQEELDMYQAFVKESLSKYNITLLGWAAAKPKYFQTLAVEQKIGLLAICLKDSSKVLVDITPDSIVEYSREQLDTYFTK